MQNKIILTVICVTFLIFGFEFCCSAEKYTFDQTESVSDIESQFGFCVSDFDLPDDVIDIFNGEDDITLPSIIEFINENGLEYFKETVKAKITQPMKTMSVIICALLIISIFNTVSFQNRFSRQFEMISDIVFILMFVKPVMALTQNSAKAIENIGVFMLSFIPIFAYILIAALQSGSATVMSSSLFLFSQVISFISQQILLPMTYGVTALSVSSSFSGNKFEFSKPVKKAVIVILSLLSTVFIGILSFKSVIFSAADSLSLKTAKFLSGNFIPIIGNSLSEMMSGLFSCISMSKSVIGLFGIISVILIGLPVCIEIIIYKLCIGVCGFISSLFGLEKIERTAKSMNEILSIIMSVVIICCVVCIFSVTIISKGGT